MGISIVDSVDDKDYIDSNLSNTSMWFVDFALFSYTKDRKVHVRVVRIQILSGEVFFTVKYSQVLLLIVAELLR